MTKTKIIDELSALIIHRLKERQSVTIDCIGTFTPLFFPEHLFYESNGQHWLMPPAVALSFLPSDYLLAANHYRSLDTTYPESYISKELTEPLSDLLEIPHTIIEATVEEELTPLLEALFRGRRTSLLSLGELYITEEIADVLLLNFAPSASIIQTLNTPFSPYKETIVPSHITWEDIEVRHERLDVFNRIEQSAINTSTQEREPSKLIGEDEVKEELNKSETEKESDETPTITITTTPPPPISQQTKRRNNKWIWSLLPLLIISGTLWYYFRHPKEKALEPMPQAEIVPQESPADTSLIPIPQSEPIEPVDTIEIIAGSSLAKFAGQYYGNNHFWVYIYMENAANIKNPNNVPIGTQLLVPPKSKYEGDLTEEEALQVATLWETVILSGRYRGFEIQKDSIYRQYSRL